MLRHHSTGWWLKVRKIPRAQQVLWKCTNFKIHVITYNNQITCRVVGFGLEKFPQKISVNVWVFFKLFLKWLRHFWNQYLQFLQRPKLQFAFLTLTDSGMDLDSDSKPDGYIVLSRTCSYYTDSDPYSRFLHGTGIRVRVCTRVNLRKCKWAITETKSQSTN